MVTVVLDAEMITSSDDFHVMSKEAFGFPDSYDMNLASWIDCMRRRDEGLIIAVPGIEDFSHRLPVLYRAFIDSIVMLNRESVEVGKEPLIALAPMGKGKP